MIKLFLITIVILILAFIAYGVRFIFEKNGQLPSSACSSSKGTSSQSSCGCGGGGCQNSN
ncbi:MAG: hypothetical protein MI922_20935 [Bacteroidales bacterium]|nr:hypothetical protein [Bacteroidales bacterium]